MTTPKASSEPNNEAKPSAERPFQNTGTVLDEIEGEFKDGKFVASHWPGVRVSGNPNLLSDLVAALDREKAEEEAVSDKD